MTNTTKYIAALLFILSTVACSTPPCGPNLDKPVPEGNAPLYAYWTDNAFPLKLVVDTNSGCTLDQVREAAAVWEQYGPTFNVVNGKFKKGKNRDYAHVYLRKGEANCRGDEDCIGHTQLSAVAPEGRAMYASVTVEDCDIELIAHELGHALGLDEVNRDGALMNPRMDRGGWEVSEVEQDQLLYICEGEVAPE